LIIVFIRYVWFWKNLLQELALAPPFLNAVDAACWFCGVGDCAENQVAPIVRMIAGLPAIERVLVTVLRGGNKRRRSTCYEAMVHRLIA
jgi:hypothetical protein